METLTHTFEENLLSHVETCYAVAMTFTHDAQKAQKLTRDVVMWAWQNHESADETPLKTKLLHKLREGFLKSGKVPSAPTIETFPTPMAFAMGRVSSR